MSKKLFFTLLIVFTIHISLLIAQPAADTFYCAPELLNTLQTIQKLKEGKQLIADVFKEGPFRIVVAHSSIPQQFGACWDTDKRTIYVSLQSHRSHGEIIGSIIFELHNALNATNFKYLDNLASEGKIAKHDYIREIEYIEYQNALEASKLAHLGVQQGIFPKSAHIYVYEDFEDHLYCQQAGGHSDVIAGNYDHLIQVTYYAYYHNYWHPYSWYLLNEFY